MTLQEWNAYTNTLSRDFAASGLTKRSDIRKFLKDKEYSKTARKFIKSYSGGGKTTPNISVNKTIDRLGKRTRANTKILNTRLAEIAKGDYTKSLKSMTTYTNELRRRAKTISDASELASTKAELKRMITVNKTLRNTKVEDLPKVIEKSMKTVNNIQFQKSIRSSASSQVKTVARTEKTRIMSGAFYDNNVAGAKDDALFDVVLSSSHTVTDICDHLAESGPYTQDTLPVLPAHVSCRCRYRKHSKASEKANNKRKGVGEMSDKELERGKQALNKKAKDGFDY
jgi:hypothetical protein